jgi:prolyl oligopeptidase
VQPGPVAQVRPVAEQYGHTTLIDNYRWMENATGPEFVQYLRAQSDAAEAALARIGGRDRIRKKIAALQNTGVSIAAVVPEGDTVFYLKRGPADDVARLMVRSADGGGERVLVDPETLPGVKPHSEILQFAPSQDGSHVEYALGTPGSDHVELRVLDVGLRQTLPDKVAASRFAGVAWRRDSKGFYYTKPEGPGAAQVLSVYLHMLHGDVGEDAIILSGGHLPFAFHGGHAIPHLIIPPSSDYALAVVSDGISPDVAVYATPLAQLDDQPAPWQSIATQDDGVLAVAPSYSIAFMLTHSKAPRMRVVSEDMAQPGFANARTVVPESAGAITAIAAASDALFVTRRQGATMHLLRLDYNDSQPQDVRLPYEGSIATGSAASPGGLVADARSPGVLFSLQGWVHPQSWFRYDPKLHRVVDLGIAPSAAPGGYDDIETVARAADGTDVPLSIIARHGVALDHVRPVLLEGYGAYGFPFDPRFMPGALAWADEGGVYAIAHVRGGGEGGEVWHAAGRLQHKETSFSDLLSCVTALEKAGYTDAAHVTAVGTTAGAVTVANAMIRSPAAFRAVAMHDGLLNPLRAETYSGGAMAVMEFGAARDPAQFPSLLAVDAFSQVKDGAEYPAVLLDVSPTAAPVPVWQSAKMAARLQAATTSARPVYLHESANAEADRLTFLLWQTGVAGFQPGVTTSPTAAKHGKSHKGLRASR